MSNSKIVRWKSTTGVAVGSDRVVAVTLAWMPGAPKELRTEEVPLGAGGLAASLKALHEKGALAGTVNVGLDARSVFFLARTRQGAAEIDSSALLEAHFAAARPDGGLVGDAMALKMRGGSYVALAACRRATADQVQEGLAPIPPAMRTIEPAPFALLRLSMRAAGTPRGWKCAIRVILDGTRGIAILTRGRAPLAWRPFASPAGRQFDALVGAVRGLAAHARGDLGVDTVDGALVHAADGGAGMAEQAKDVCGMDVRVAPFVSLDEKNVALGLALAAVQPAAAGPNLLRQLRPPLTFRQIFPWSTAAIVTIAVGVSWQALASATGSCEARVGKARSRIASSLKAARTKQPDLKTARASAHHEAELVSRFVMRRAQWAKILRELPAHLPEATVLIGFTGRDQLVLPSVDKPDEKCVTVRDLAIQGEVRVKKDDAAPEDVAGILSGIAQFPSLLEACPRVDGAEVTRHPGKEGDVASFVVRCGSKR